MSEVQRIFTGSSTEKLPLKKKEEKVRVAAYCRVSTELETQQSSFDLQIESYKTQIAMRPTWELVDIYADDGISGTDASKRPEFMRMIKDCEEGKIDYIITKSISRFARNTLECLSYVRRLQSCGTQLLFEKENIDTGTAFSEMLLTILAAFAQEESRSLSENAKWSYRKRFEAGYEKRARVFGYRHEKDEKYVIVPEQAKTIRLLFDLYEGGMPLNPIARKLNDEGWASARGGKWTPAIVDSMLRNEKYVGDVMMQKVYSVDHLSHKSVKNDQTILPSYYIKDHHTPIVSRKQYDRVQRIIQLRTIRGLKSAYPYDDKLVCPICGERLVKHQMKSQDQRAAWHCDRNENSCNRYILKPHILDEAVLEAYKTFDTGQLKLLNGKKTETMLAMKKAHLTLKTVDFYWLDELVDKVTFGKDYKLNVHWKCGITTTETMLITRMRDDPVYLAELCKKKLEKEHAKQISE